MARKKSASATGSGGGRRRAPRQMDLFGSPSAESNDGALSWHDLPNEARNALVNLITHLMLDHARKAAVAEISHDH